MKIYYSNERYIIKQTDERTGKMWLAVEILNDEFPPKLMDAVVIVLARSGGLCIMGRVWKYGYITIAGEPRYFAFAGEIEWRYDFELNICKNAK